MYLYLTMGGKIIIILIIFTVAQTQCKLIVLSCKQIRAFVDGHNSRRLLLAEGKIPDQPPAGEMNNMIWDEELHTKAAKWVVKSHNYHNPDRTVPSDRFTTGENLYWYSTTNSKFEIDPDMALKSWFSEHVNYTYGPLQASDFDISKNYDIGHYTQMVWSDTVYIGCAISQVFKNGWNKFYIICNYGPGGNYINEKPYKSSIIPSEKLICGAISCDHLYGQKCKNDTVNATIIKNSEENFLKIH